MTFAAVGPLLGGMGLFLLGMKLMTDGLRLAAGRALRDILSTSTKTPVMGLASGFTVTAMVQSSSAVTVASLGFVNAGLLTLSQTIWVIYGSNVGTTVTGWLVALLGFKIDIKLLSLPLIGLGMALNVLGGGNPRRAALGEALAGFGVFFLGIDILKSGFGGVGQELSLAGLPLGGTAGVAAFLAIGFGLTVMMQASSAAMVVVLTAASQGVISLDVAAAAVIGANLGTTSTAVLAAIGATPNAKRVAAAHVTFNLMAAVVALAFLPLIPLGIETFARFIDIQPTTVGVLAAFHTVFNVLGVLVMWPLTRPMTRRLARLFATEEEDLGAPRYLDKNVVKTPALAVGALAMELGRMGDMARQVVAMAVLRDDPPAVKIMRRKEALASLDMAVAEFVADLSHANLTPRMGTALPRVLRVGQYYLSAGANAVNAILARPAKPISDGPLLEKIGEYRAQAELLVKMTAPCKTLYDREEADSQLGLAVKAYKEVKEAVLDAGARNALPVGDMAAWLESFSQSRRALEQVAKGARYLVSLPDYERLCPKESGEEAPKAA